MGGYDEDQSLLSHVLEENFCSSLSGRDNLVWSPSPRGKFTVAQGYAILDKNLHDLVEVHWWKKVWSRFSWTKCNFFLWFLA